MTAVVEVSDLKAGGGVVLMPSIVDCILTLLKVDPTGVTPVRV